MKLNCIESVNGCFETVVDVLMVSAMIHFEQFQCLQLRIFLYFDVTRYLGHCI